MDVYVLLKILKYCNDSPLRSYQMKFAVDQVFNNKGIDSTEDIGKAIKEITHHYTIRGKFSSVHPDLAAEGITRVEVGEEGLHFMPQHFFVWTRSGDVQCHCVVAFERLANLTASHDGGTRSSLATGESSSSAGCCCNRPKSSSSSDCSMRWVRYLASAARCCSSSRTFCSYCADDVSTGVYDAL